MFLFLVFGLLKNISIVSVHTLNQSTWFRCCLEINRGRTCEKKVSVNLKKKVLDLTTSLAASKENLQIYLLMLLMQSFSYYP